MMKIRNYICNYKDGETKSSLQDEIDASVVFSDINSYKKAAEDLSKNGSFVFFPITNTLEAELQGALINENSLIRVKNPIITDVEKLFSLKEFNYTISHYKIMSECLNCKYDKPLAYEMTGFYTFLSFIIPAEKIFRTFRKNPETEKVLANLFLKKYFSFINTLNCFDIKLISLADPAASVDIIGPSALENTINNFYVPLLDYILHYTKFSIYLCPKLSFVMEDLGFLKGKTIEIEKKNVQDAIKALTAEKNIFGNICINLNPEINRIKVFEFTKGETDE